MANSCFTPAPVAGVFDITDPIAEWCTCMLTPYIRCYCHIAAIAGFLMGRGFDANTALMMAQDMMRQQMGMMGGMGQMGQMGGMMPMSPVAGMPGMNTGFPVGPR
jgi:hypothetical protein